MLLALLLAAAPVSVAVPGVKCVGMQQALCDSFLDRFLAQLSGHGDLEVMNQTDIAALIGLERQKQLLGCSDSASAECIAELAGALGADGLLSMSITRSDPYFVATARVVRSKDATAWTAATERVQREGDLFEAMDKIAAHFASVLAPSAATAPVADVQGSRRSPRLLPFVPAVLGVIAAGVGVGVFLSAANERSALERHVIAGDLAMSAVEIGRTKEQAGVALWISAGVAVAASIVWLLVFGPSEKT